MTRYSKPVARFSVIEFNELPKPLPSHADNIRNALEFYQFHAFDEDSDWLRFSNKENVTHATGVLLEALVTPYSMHIYDRFQFQREHECSSSDYPEIDDDDHDEMQDMLNSKISNLIKWRRNADGSIVFLTKEGEVSPSEIGVVIAQNDLGDFFEIVAEQLMLYGKATFARVNQ